MRSSRDNDSDKFPSYNDNENSGPVLTTMTISRVNVYEKFPS